MIVSLKHYLTCAIQQTPSADNSQPWHIHWSNNSLSLCYDAERVAEQTFPANSPATLLAIGAAIENLRQAAAQLKLEIQIDTSTYTETTSPSYFIAHFNQADLSQTVATPPSAIFDRHTNRLAYSNKPLTDDTIALLKKLTLGNAKVICFTDKQKIRQLAKLVRKASEIRFKTREINEWLGRSLRFGTEAERRKDGLDVATLDLPLGGSLFLRLISDWNRMSVLNLFGAYLTMSIIDSAPVKKAPALLAITAPSTVEGIMQAGQLMEKLWIELNSKGIAVHPYYVICDQLHRRKARTIPKGLEKKADKIFADTQALFQFNDGDALQMLLRIGYPEKVAKRSQRLPVDIISED